MLNYILIYQALKGLEEEVQNVLQLKRHVPLLHAY
jgi:hypothetical protein